MNLKNKQNKVEHENGNIIEAELKFNRLVGKVKSAHGLKGEVYCLIFSGDTSWIKQLKQLVISSAQNISQRSHSDKIYSVQKVKPFKDGVIVSFDGVSDRNQSELLSGQYVWVEETLFSDEKSGALYLVQIENFMVVDLVLGNIGQIIGFSSNGAQDLLLVKYQDQLVEIPFVDAFVSRINYEDKTVNMNLPEGLLELHLPLTKADIDHHENDEDTNKHEKD